MGVARILTIVAAVAALLVLFLMLRSGRLREKYALLWLALGVVTLVLAVFPGLLRAIADLAGVAVPANLIFALSIVLLGGVAIHLSWELSVLEDETRTLSEEVAILRADVAELRERADAAERADDAAPDGPDRTDGSDGEPDR
jgi:hypothetical protein